MTNVPAPTSSDRLNNALGDALRLASNDLQKRYVFDEYDYSAGRWVFRISETLPDFDRVSEFFRVSPEAEITSTHRMFGQGVETRFDDPDELVRVS